MCSSAGGSRISLPSRTPTPPKLASTPWSSGPSARRLRRDHGALRPAAMSRRAWPTRSASNIHCVAMIPRIATAKGILQAADERWRAADCGSTAAAILLTTSPMRHPRTVSPACARAAGGWAARSRFAWRGALPYTGTPAPIRSREKYSGCVQCQNTRGVRSEKIVSTIS